jgi:chromosome segregation ATPase
VLGENVRALKDQIAGETEARQKTEVELAVLKQELATLKIELANLRGKLKAKSAMADLEAHMARLEAPASPARLKTIAG